MCGGGGGMGDGNTAWSRGQAAGVGIRGPIEGAALRRYRHSRAKRGTQY